MSPLGMLLHLPALLLLVQLLLNHHQLRLLLLSVVLERVLVGQHEMRLVDVYSFVSFCEKLKITFDCVCCCRRPREVTRWPARDDDKYFLLVFVRKTKNHF